MSEPFEAQDKLKLRPPSATEKKPQGSEDSALRYRGGDALKRTPTTFVGTQVEPIVSLERLEFEVPDRTGLSPVAHDAHPFVPVGGGRVVGSTAASRGWHHPCRPFPVVP